MSGRHEAIQPTPAGDLTGTEMVEVQRRVALMKAVADREQTLRSEADDQRDLLRIVQQESESFARAIVVRLGLDPSHQYRVDADTGRVIMVAVWTPVTAEGATDSGGSS